MMRARLATVLALILLAVTAGWLWWPRAHESATADRTATTTLAPPQEAFADFLQESYGGLERVLAGRDKAAPPDAAARRQRVDGLFQAVRAIERTVPRDTFDFDIVIAETGRDSARLHKWVRERTIWVPYVGTLRGALGVLMDRAGNSLDRSLLLVRLAGAAGLQARLAHAQLQRPEVAQLQKSLFAATPADSGGTSQPANTHQAVSDAIAAFAKEFGIDAAPVEQRLEEAGALSAKVRERVMRRVAAQASGIVSGLNLSAAGSQDSSTDEAPAIRDHWWVQVHIGDAWVDMDPALPTAGASVTPAQATLGPDDVAADLHHSLRIRVLVEKWDGSAFLEQEALSADLTPSELVGETVRLQHLPMAWPRNGVATQAQLKETALAQHEWLPVLTIGSRRVTRASIMDTGDLNAKPGARTLSAPITGMVDAFGGGDPAPAGILTAEWIEYEFRSPGSPARTTRREIFDTVGGAARSGRQAPPASTPEAQLARALGMLQDTEMLPLACQPSLSFVEHLNAQRLFDNESVLKSLAGADTPPGGQERLETLNKLVPMPGPLYVLALARSQWRGPETGVYLRQINLLTRHRFVRPAEDGSLRMVAAFDIVANEVFAANGQPQDRLLVQVRQGVLDSNAEVLLSGQNPAMENAAGTFAEPSRWIALRKEQDLERLALPPNLRARLQEQFHAGYVALAPPELGAAGAHATWWRVDPRTGDTLSFGDRGWGQEAAEYAFVVATPASFALCLAMVRVIDGSVTEYGVTFCVAAAITTGGAVMVPFGSGAGWAIELFGLALLVVASDPMNRR